MKEDQIRIAIAEFCGWRKDDKGYWRNRIGHYATNQSWAGGLNLLPDYSNDLNAMHQAEKQLNEKQQIFYMHRLTQIRLRHGEGGTIACLRDKAVFATAAQRAEALLKTIGKWHESRNQVAAAILENHPMAEYQRDE